jgi:hypothetical protein
MASIEQVTYNSPDGATMGKSGTEKISFYGRTPVVIQTKPTALGTVVFSQIATSGKWGFSSSTVAKTVAPRIDSICTKLYNLGLFS